MNNTKQRLIRTYVNIRRNYEIILYLTKRKNRAISILVNSDELLSHWCYLTFKDLHIEIDKAISFRKPKNKKETDFVFSGLVMHIFNESNLNENKKAKLYNKILTLKDAIKTIRNTRDKFYAHIDADYESYLGNQSLRDIEKIVFLIQDIMCKIFGNKEVTEILNTIPSSNDYSILQNLLDLDLTTFEKLSNLAD